MIPRLLISFRKDIIPFFTNFTLLGLYVADCIFFRSLTGPLLLTTFSGSSMINLIGSLTQSTGFEFQQLVVFSFFPLLFSPLFSSSRREGLDMPPRARPAASLNGTSFRLLWQLEAGESLSGTSFGLLWQPQTEADRADS